jgi:glycosyltransferase involved in cell wall biosynthesis
MKTKIRRPRTVSHVLRSWGDIGDCADQLGWAFRNVEARPNLGSGRKAFQDVSHDHGTIDVTKKKTGTHFGLDLLVVSHACVVAANQEVFRCLRERGTLLKLVVPDRWCDAYREKKFLPNALGGMEDVIVPVRTVGVGRPQRHAYVRNLIGLLRQLQPDVILIEEEPHSLAALEWGIAASMLGLPFGVQAAETLDRVFPSPIVKSRNFVLRRASFVLARSPGARSLANRWGARGEVTIVPHAVPSWPTFIEREPSGQFTVGYAGRLVPEKGLDDLVTAVFGMETSARLLLVGDGPMRDQLQRTAPWVDVIVGHRHEEMNELFTDMDVLVLPSRTTATWEEQFGRVLVEALWCGTPVVGAESGQIPWVVNTTGGGRTYPEGDIKALSKILDELSLDPGQRRAMATRGRDVVENMFSAEAVATTLAGVLCRAKSSALSVAECGR